MKNEALFFKILNSKNRDENRGVVAIPFDEFRIKMRLENRHTRDIRKDIFPVLIRSRLLAKYYQNLELETLKFFGRGNKIFYLIASWVDKQIDEKMREKNKNLLIEKLKKDDFEKYKFYIKSKLAKNTYEKLKQKKTEKVQKEILKILKKDKVIKSTNLLLILKNKFEITRLEILEIFKKLEQEKMIFSFFLKNLDGKIYLSLDDNKKSVFEFYEKNATSEFFSKNGNNFLKAFCYKASLSNEMISFYSFISLLKKNIKENFGINFNHDMLKNICYEKSQFIRFSTNSVGTRFFYFNKKTFTQTELKQIKEDAKMWKFLKI